MAPRAITTGLGHRVAGRTLLILILLAVPVLCHAGPGAAKNNGITATAQKIVPVKIQTRGTPSFGHRVAETRAKPGTVLVSGPADVLAEMDEARTHPVDITGISENLRREIGLDLPHDVRAVVGNQRVTAIIGIKPQITEKTFKAIPIKAVNADLPYNIHPDTVQVTLRGPVHDFSGSFSKTDIRVYVDLGGLKPGLYVRPVRINPPGTLRLTRVTPQVFTIRIYPENTIESGKD